jgi:hypothetical protein
MYAAKPAVQLGGCGMTWAYNFSESGLFIGFAGHASKFIQVQMQTPNPEADTRDFRR